MVGSETDGYVTDRNPYTEGASRSQRDEVKGTDRGGHEPEMYDPRPPPVSPNQDPGEKTDDVSKIH